VPFDSPVKGKEQVFLLPWNAFRQQLLDDGAVASAYYFWNCYYDLFRYDDGDICC